MLSLLSNDIMKRLGRLRDVLVHASPNLFVADAAGRKLLLFIIISLPHVVAITAGGDLQAGLGEMGGQRCGGYVSSRPSSP